MAVSKNVLALTGYDQSYRWNAGAPLGTPMVVTYSFSKRKPGYDNEARPGFAAFSAAHQKHIKAALDVWAKASGLTFIEVPANKGGQIRFAMESMAGKKNSTGGTTSGYGYYPAVEYGYDTDTNKWSLLPSFTGDSLGGDVFLKTGLFARNPGSLAPGQRGFSLLLHEIGHAIGFKHPFEGSPKINPKLDKAAYTVMSYDRSPTTTKLGSLDKQAAHLYYGKKSYTVKFDEKKLKVDITATNASQHVFGTELNDIMRGLGGNDTMRSGPGNDRVYGGIGNDLLYGGDGNDTLSGDAGADRIHGEAGRDVLQGGRGNDRLYGGDVNDRLKGEVGADRIYGDAGKDVLQGGRGNDRLYGGDGNDKLKGDVGADLIYGDAGRDVLQGGRGNDRLYGGDGNDVLRGEGGNDKLYGDRGNDRLEGGAGKDRLIGGDGNDTLYGDVGADVLSGGIGRDTFVYKSVRDSKVAASGRDIITDFSTAQRDRIDLSAIDANTRASGNNAFDFIKTEAFTKTEGELRYEYRFGDTFVFGDVNGDGVADFSIRLDTQVAFRAADFIL